ncbi:MAG TPA: GFA family protein [Caulobacteraceae bacterium]|jgi:hypothetical protein
MKTPRNAPGIASGRCACGAVEVEIGVPARWAWHDHCAASRLAHGAAYATYVGAYRSRFRIKKGADMVSRFEEPDSGHVRSFCRRCGAPIAYERKRAPEMVNLPRALFTSSVGREPRYHLSIHETPDWAYAGEKLLPLKGFPGVVWARPRRKTKVTLGDLP